MGPSCKVELEYREGTRDSSYRVIRLNTSLKPTGIVKTQKFRKRTN